MAFIKQWFHWKSIVVQYNLIEFNNESTESLKIERFMENQDWKWNVKFNRQVITEVSWWNVSIESSWSNNNLIDD